MSQITTRRFALWTQLFKEWLSNKFASITNVIGTPTSTTNTTLFKAIEDVANQVEAKFEPISDEYIESLFEDESDSSDD